MKDKASQTIRLVYWDSVFSRVRAQGKLTIGPVVLFTIAGDLALVCMSKSKMRNLFLRMNTKKVGTLESNMQGPSDYNLLSLQKW